MRSYIHGHRAHASQQNACGKAHDRGCCERAHHVIQQAANAGGEDCLLALFGVIALDHADATQRFREPTGDFGIDLAALTENRPDGRERFIQCNAETHKRAYSDQGHLRTGAKQQNQRNSGGDQASGKIHQACTQKIAHAFHVAHDSGYETASLIRVIKGHRQARNVRLNLLAQLGDQPLRRLRQRLRQ